MAPLLETALSALDAVHSAPSAGADSSGVANGPLQLLRDALSVLSCTLQAVPATEGHADCSLHDIIGASAVAASEAFFQDDTAVRKAGLFGYMSETHQEIEGALSEVGAAAASAAIASASASALSSSLEIERSARAAADVRVSILQREYQNIKQQLDHLKVETEAYSSSSQKQVQHLSHELALLQASFHSTKHCGI